MKRKFKVAVIDDSENYLFMIDKWGDTLDPAIELVTFEDPKEFIEVVKKEHYDAAIIDRWMPKIKGSYLGLYLKGQYPGIVTVLMTGEDPRLFKAEKEAFQFDKVTSKKGVEHFRDVLLFIKAKLTDYGEK